MVSRADLDGGNLVYTPPEDAYGTAYARFTFQVSDGEAESASAYTMTIDVTAVNDVATGEPSITGTAQVGEVLTAALGTLADVDGCRRRSPATTRSSGCGSTAPTRPDIEGATSGTPHAGGGRRGQAAQGAGELHRRRRQRRGAHERGVSVR